MHARLLGIRLLTLDARVVVATDVDTRTDALAVPDRLTLVAPDPDAVPVERARREKTASRGAAPHPPVVRVRAGDVSTARELLAAGADTLARTRSTLRGPAA